MNDEKLIREVIEECIKQLSRVSDLHIRMGVLQYLTFLVQADYFEGEYEQQSETESRETN